jgi:class 3 adenylate cyclase
LLQFFAHTQQATVVSILLTIRRHPCVRFRHCCFIVPMLYYFRRCKTPWEALSRTADWLASVGLAEYSKCFAENRIDLSVLPHLTDQDLKDLGVVLGDRRKMLRAISELRGAVPGTPGPGPALRPEEAAERRQLTVMFCDLVGSTALSTELDPEDLWEIIRIYHRDCGAVIVEYGGFVARYMGDGMLSYFGYPQAYEDNAERAVRASLKLVRAVTKLDARSGKSLQVRVGIATGLVVIDDLLADEPPHECEVVGETPNLAARLQALADPNTVIVDSNTRRLLGHLFEYRVLGPFSLKGFQSPVTVWQVTGVSAVDNRFEALHVTTTAFVGRDETELPSPPGGPRHTQIQRAHSSGLTPFVGRVRELELLASFRPEAGGVRVIDIVGEPGIGKSRLLHEFRGRLTGHRIFVLSGNCWPHHTQTALRPFIEVARRTFQLGAEDAEADAARKLDAGLTRLGLATKQNLALLLNLLGLKRPVGALHGLDEVMVGLRTRQLLLSVLQARSLITPVVMVLEDLHWIDNASQELLARLIAEKDTGPLAILHTRRPSYQPPWGEAQTTATLLIEPLAISETTQIVQARLGALDPAATLVRLIADRAEGNPLFAEEIANFLIDAGIVRRRGTILEYDAAAVTAALPGSVQSLLTARVDQLAPNDRALLQAASVIGRRFRPNLLAATIQSGSVRARLAALEKLDIIGFDANSMEYVFKHVLVRDALYASLLGGPRKALHLRIAAEIERRHLGQLSVAAEVLAHHYLQADHRDKAVEYLAVSGRKSLGIYSLDEAEHSLRTALALARFRDSARMDAQVAAIMVDLAIVLYLTFRSSETVALIEPELERIDALGDSEHVPILLDFYGISLLTRSRFNDGRHVADKALEMAERLGDHRAKAHARACVIMLSIFVDPMSLDDFERFVKNAVSEAESGGYTFIAGRMMMAIAWNYVHRGLCLEGRQWAYRLMKFGRHRQDHRALGMALWVLGFTDFVAGNYASALGHGEECAKTALAPFDRHMGEFLVGMSQVLLGRAKEGCETLHHHGQVALTNDWHWTAMGRDTPLAVASLLRGDFRKGVRRLEAIVRYRETKYGYQVYADWTRMILAEFYIDLLQGTRKLAFGIVMKNLFFLLYTKRVAPKRAELLLRTALRNSQFSDRGLFRARLDFNLGRLYQATRRVDLARPHFDSARRVALAQEATSLIDKIDEALRSLPAMSAP